MKNLIILFSLMFSLSSCGTSKLIFVSSYLEDCSNDPSKKCLKVKEQKEDEWTLIHNDIKDFNHQEGIDYTIKVKVEKNKDEKFQPAAVKYKLLKIMSEKQSQKKEAQININGKWKLTEIIGFDALEVTPTLQLDLAAKIASGNAGCNNYSASFTLEQQQITFGLAMVTKMFCSNMKTEKAFLNSLSEVKTYQLLEKKLIFYDSNNAELLQFDLLE